MHIEIQVALNFLISFLYNKLPRRRVNQFGEELEKALKVKFEGHWYPEKPFKGSAFRCLKTAPPLEPVFEVAAREAGMALADIQENLPKELSIWVDPGEVSYRMGEKLPVKILYSDGDASQERGHGAPDREVIRTFNPEAQCFKPIDSLSSQLAGLGLQNSVGGGGNHCVLGASGGSTSPTECGGSTGSSPASPDSSTSNSPTACQVFASVAAATSNSSSTTSSPGSTSPTTSATTNTTYRTSSNNHGGNSHNASSSNSNNSTTNNPSFLGGKTPALTFTTAAFAQTKFGSTKLKTSSKRSHRMSPTEFSAYIKQRAILQQQQQQQQQQQSHSAAAASMFVAAAAAAAAATGQQQQNGRPRSLSPMDPGYLLVGPGGQGSSQQQSPNSSSSLNQQNHMMTSPFSNGPASQAPTSRSFGVFDHGYLGDLFAAAAGSKLNHRSSNSSNLHQQSLHLNQQQQQANQIPSRFSPYHMQDKPIDPFGSSMSGNPVSNGLPSSSGNAAVSPGGNGNGGNKSYQQNNRVVDPVGFNLSVTSYPNQYQHLLVAN